MIHRSAVLAPLVVFFACAAPTRHGDSQLQPGSRLGTVSSASPEATAAGLDVLAAGGNAIDAAVAVAFSLGVTEPAGSGLGGQAFLLVQRPGEAAFVVHGSTLSPAATDPNAGSAEVRGRRASTVPSMVRVMDFAHRSFGSGTMAWRDLLEPAARHAENGFALGSFRRNSVARYAGALAVDPAVREVFLAADGGIPEVGDLCRQPALARTIRRLAEAGGDDFYRGEIAAAIADDMAANGGWITAADLEAYPEPRVGPALQGSYRGWTVSTLPPPTGGWVVLFALNFLENAKAATMTAGGDQAAIWMAEALRAAHDRRLSAPIRSLEDYEQAVQRRVRKQTAADVVEELRMPGGTRRAAQPDGTGSGETTHFSVVDKDGTVVAATLSLNAYFGAKVMSRELGILYNDYMREFEFGSPGHAFALRPGAMPYSSMSATILSKDGVPQFGVGSPGSRRIISAVVQTVSNYIDRGLDPAAAVAAPRMHVVPEDDDLMLEARPRSRALLRDLELRGFSLAIPLSSLFAEDRNPYFGGVHAVGRVPDGGWAGGADPRRDGVAASVDAR
ncbi:MAG: gamma-glutamyltransferase family protein [Planctomycetota bacterium]